MRWHLALRSILATTAAASGERAASGAACLLYDGSSHYDVFSPAAGPALKIPRGLPAGAENARHVHQVLRCSDDLDLSRCTALAPEVPRCWEDASWHDLGCVAALAPPSALSIAWPRKPAAGHTAVVVTSRPRRAGRRRPA